MLEEFVNNIWWNAADRLLIFSTFVLVAYNLYLNRKKTQSIKVYLHNTETGQCYEVFKVTRQDCSRSEIQGVLRNKLKKGVRDFDIDYLSDARYLQDIRKIQQNRKNTLRIQVSAVEIKPFRVSEEKNIKFTDC